MNLGDKIDLYYSIRAKRLELEREAEQLKNQETMLDAQLKDELIATALAGAKGAKASYSIKPEVVPLVISWDDMYKYIASTMEFDLLHKRIGATAWRDRFESGLLVPGTASDTIYKSSLRKV